MIFRKSSDEMKKLLCAASLLVCAACATTPQGGTAQAAPPPSDFTGAAWMWADDPRAKGFEYPAGAVTLRATLELPEGTDPASVYLSASVDNEGIVRVNGTQVLTSDNWKSPPVVAIGEFLRLGANEVVVEATNAPPTPNPAGVLLRVWTSDGETLLLSGPRWEGEVEGEWKPAAVLALAGRGPWGKVGDATKEKLPMMPKWSVQGLEEDFEALRELASMHYKPHPHVPFYDPWMTLGGAWVESPDERVSDTFRRTLRMSYEGFRVLPDGYMSTHQHRGAAHPDGWPFPTWTQAGGWGHHWTRQGMPYGPELGIHEQRDMEGFALENATVAGYEDFRGSVLALQPGARLTTPETDIDSLTVPFFRIDWVGEAIPGARPRVQWREVGQGWDDANSVEFSWVDVDRGGGLHFTAADLQDLARSGKRVAQFRVHFGNDAPAEIGLQAMMTAVDSRHNNNNINFVRGDARYANWTGEADYLETQLPRMRAALAYAVSEFNTREALCIDTPWVAHGGASGLQFPNGEKVRLPASSIGNNYWDLLPFGGKDALATIYFYDAMQVLADLEERVAADPALAHLHDPNAPTPEQWREHAREVREFAGNEFWNPATGRFTAGIAADGTRADYGFTFMNLEAVYFGFATDEQARSILAWIAGDRIVQGDTSTGEDIYHWRFGPRSTTLRNVQYYADIWPSPESIAWGGQVQDGGAVLGFTHFDLVSRAVHRGPDDAWGRLSEIIAWHRDVQAEGGVRSYYNKEGRGTLQGGGTAGGIGIDFEFIESVLTPGVLLYGFAGIEPRLDAIEVGPRIPSAWGSYTMPGIFYQGRVLELEATADAATITVTSGNGPARRVAPAGDWALAPGDGGTFSKAGDTVRLVRAR